MELDLGASYDSNHVNPTHLEENTLGAQRAEVVLDVVVQ